MIDLVPLLISVGLSALIGIERQIAGAAAGLRTHMLVCISATLLTLISLIFLHDPARIIAGLVTGIGFIGAGTIMASAKTKHTGLTTAASLFAVMSLGILIGLEYYLISFILTLLIIFVLELWRLEVWLGIKGKKVKKKDKN